MTARCRKIAPYTCPRCRKTGCTTDHWDVPMGGPCAICGGWECRASDMDDHREQCVLNAGHKGPCKDERARS